ncbi:hypothetical protein MAPG_04513 [Magnaporthiopsis poae ATCC 64411]|uniref:Glutamate-1-semialdehyde 2,1-aminomutase n=1 Tax=Magnaporthiopsis poae (strain ATCC 64411 / 73-15) TaxID=644358 RepID=A0A0C4DWX9_MAGP6|nr:hypothetical protein MAPG_04513 [Magnaporthiopsis poae ATCC 64411]
MAGTTADDSQHSGFAVTRDIDAIPRVFRHGFGRFTHLHCSKPGENAPLTVGTWAVARVENGEEVVVPDADEVKFVTKGRSVWKNADTGEIFDAGVGSTIWLPKGSRSILVSADGLETFYVVASTQEMTVPEDVGRGAAFQTRAHKLLSEYRQRYVAANPKSADSLGRASASLAGGNTRSVLHYDPFPMVLVSGRECYVTSEDGREYVDFVSEYSACMLGHSHPAVTEAVQAVMKRGINLGGPSREEQVLAALLTDRIPSMQRIRFCNSGTEANTMALTLARHHTGRQKMLAFEKGYHGGFIGFNSDGVLPTTLPFDFVLARYDDADHVRELVDDDSFAAIIVEPMQSVGGMIPASRAFLQTLREVADRTGAVLIFDEVVTSRLHYNALQSHHGVLPDLTTIGKFWGGGFSFGAFGGRADIMAATEPPGPGGAQRLNHSGTFNNNAFSMTAGAVACRLITKEVIATANALGDRLREGITAAGGPSSSPWMWATGIGSMLNVHFGGPIATELGELFFLFMLDRGVYVARRGLVALNMMHTDDHVSQMLGAVRDFVQELVQVDF